MAESLIEAANADLIVINRLLKYPTSDDDSTLGIIGYHLQQAVEKSLKAVLEDIGVDYRSLGHSIGKCYRTVNHYKPGIISDETANVLVPYINLLTDWESSGRYPSDSLFMLSELKKLEVIAHAVYNEVAAYLGYPEFKADGVKGTKGVSLLTFSDDSKRE